MSTFILAFVLAVPPPPSTIDEDLAKLARVKKGNVEETTDAPPVRTGPVPCDVQSRQPAPEPPPPPRKADTSKLQRQVAARNLIDGSYWIMTLEESLSRGFTPSPTLMWYLGMDDWELKALRVEAVARRQPSSQIQYEVVPRDPVYQPTTYYQPQWQAGFSLTGPQGASFSAGASGGG